MNLDFLAQRIRDFRKKRGLTLEQLADRSQLTQSVLSKVENTRVTPSLAALSRIAEALGVSLSELVSGIDEKRRMRVVRRKEREPVDRDRGNPSFAYESLSQRKSGQLMEPLLVRIPPGEGRKDLLSHEGEEFILVLKGSIEVECGPEKSRLGPGDAVYLESSEKHRVSNVASSEAEILVVCAGETRS